VTEAKSPRDRLLEVVVFAPTGLAMTLVEEFPRLVDKGRHRIEGQVHTARLVGQFAVQMGRRRMEQTVARRGPSDAPAPPRPAPGVGPDGPAPAAEPTVPSPADVGGGAGVERAGPQGAAGNGAPPALAIPNYDSLSASQVVQRLDGLSAAELLEVREHEAGHRHRRTILHRVEQLLAPGDLDPG